MSTGTHDGNSTNDEKKEKKKKKTQSFHNLGTWACAYI